MKKVLICLMPFIMLLLSACGADESFSPSEVPNFTFNSNYGERTVDDLKLLYPEFFENDFDPAKGIEVYVWQLATDYYSCGMMLGTNRNKTEQEIWSLWNKSMSIEEAKMLLNAINIDKSNVFIIPTTHPLSSYAYEITPEYTEHVRSLFD